MDYIAAAPEMTLLGLICVVMIVDLFVEQENRIVTFWLSMLSLAVLAIVLWATAPETRRNQWTLARETLIGDDLFDLRRRPRNFSRCCYQRISRPRCITSSLRISLGNTGLVWSQ